jgi:hypothetical protein
LLDLRASGVRYVFAILQDLTIRHYQTSVLDGIDRKACW